MPEPTKRRAICQLSFAEQILVWGTRAWLTGPDGQARVRAELMRALGEAEGHATASALAGFLSVFNSAALRTMYIGPLTCRMVWPDEERLLAAIRYLHADLRHSALLVLDPVLPPAAQRVALERASGGIAVRSDLQGRLAVEAGEGGDDYLRGTAEARWLAGAGTTRILARGYLGVGTDGLPAYRAFALDHTSYFLLLWRRSCFGEVGGPEREEARAHADAAFRCLSTSVGRVLAEQDRPAKDVEPLAFAVWSSVHGAVLLELAGVAGPDPEAAYGRTLQFVEAALLSPRL